MSAVQSRAPFWRVYIGTYTDGASEGIYLAHLDKETGRLDAAGPACTAVNPSFLAFHPTLATAYAVGETTSEDGMSGGSVSAFRIEEASGRLTLIATQPSMGGAPCHIAVAPGGRHVAAANYMSGTIALYPVLEGGALAPASDWVQHEDASGARRPPRAHSTIFDGAGRLIAADLGVDTLFVYDCDEAGGRLIPNDPHTAPAEQGGGPRHAVFAPSKRFLYVVNEYGSSVTVFAYNAASGALRRVQTVSALPDGFSGETSAAEIRLHPSGRFLYASNRGADTIATFEVDGETGRIRSVAHTPSGGCGPRNFNLTPDGRFLLAANQHSDNVVVFRVEEGGRTLAPTGQRIEVPAAVCVRFRGETHDS